MMMVMARSLLLSPFPGWVTAHSSPPLLSAAALPHTPTHTLPYIAPVHCPIHCPNPPQLSYHSLRRPIRHSLLKWWTDSPPIHWSAQKWLEEICGAGSYNLIMYFVTIWNSLFVFAERCHFVAQTCDRKFVPHRRALQPLRKSTHWGKNKYVYLKV